MPTISYNDCDDTDGHAWFSSAANAEVDDANETDTSLSGGSSRYLNIGDWDGGVSVPSDATIDDIYVRVRCYADNGPDPNYVQLSIMPEGGTRKYQAGYIANGTATEYTLSGSPSYWGLSNSEAIDVLQDTEANNCWRIYGYLDRPAHFYADFNIEFVEIQVDYTEAPPPDPGSPDTSAISVVASL